MHPRPIKLALVFSFVLLTACGGQPSLPPEEDLTESAVPAPVGATAPDLAALGAPAASEIERVSNGLFDQGAEGWTQSTRRGEWGTSGAIIGVLPPDVAPPLNGRSRVARLCGYPTEQITASASARGTCNDILSTTIEVPAGARNLTLRVSALARYDCPAEQRGAFVLALTPLDGLGNPTPRAVQFKDLLQLPPGEWQDLTIPVIEVPGLATQARSFKLALLFSTGVACKPDGDIGTYVLVTDISARVNL